MTDEIVIVEDDESIAWMLTEQLRRECPDTRIYNFFDPFSALEHVRNQPPSLLITDLRMLGMSGFDLLHRLRKFAPELPAILITADTSPETRFLAERYGICAYLEKPFDCETLMQAVGKVLPRTSLAVEAAVGAMAAVTAGADLRVASFTGAPTLTAQAIEEMVLELEESENDDWIPQDVEIGPLTSSSAALSPQHTHQPAELQPTAPDSEEYWLETLLSDDFPAKGSVRLSLKSNNFGLPGRTNTERNGLPYDTWCQDLSQQLGTVEWCALLDCQTQTLAGSYCPTTNLAEAAQQVVLLGLAESLFGQGPLPSFRLVTPTTAELTAPEPVQEVQVLYPNAVLLGKVLKDSKLVLLLQSSAVQYATRLAEQVRGWLLLSPPHVNVSVDILADGQLHASTTNNGSATRNGALAEGQARFDALVEAFIEETSNEEPGTNAAETDFATAIELSANTRVTKPLTPPVIAPPASAPVPAIELSEPEETGWHPPLPGLKPDAELVTPLWLGEVLAAEIVPLLNQPAQPLRNVAVQPDTWTFRADKFCLRTSTRQCYPDLVAANKALQDCLKDRMGLGELHASDTFFVLTPDDEGAYWLWTVTPWLTTLEAELQTALATQDEVALAAGLCKFAEAVLCSLQISLKKRLLLTVEPENFATLYEGGPLVYIGDEIEHGYCLTEIGSTILSRAAEFAAWPRAVSVYLDVFGLGVCNRFNREQVRRIDVLRSLREAPIHTEGMLRAQTQLIERIRRCPE